MLRLKKELLQKRYIYLMALPIFIYFFIFSYVPMYGVIISFKNYSPRAGILGSPWVGLKYFISFFSQTSSLRVIRNTFLISFYDMLWGFPSAVILALLLNEVKHMMFKRTVQTITYMPYFISTVVICGLIKVFCASDGFINDILQYVGIERVDLLSKAQNFRSIYISTNIWQGVGFGSIIYLGALSGISLELYDAADADGANRWQKMIHVTLPGISETIIIMLILRIGSLLGVGYEKILLLYNEMTYETADVISTFVYRKGLLDANYGYATSVGLWNSAINFLLLYAANRISRKVSETSLW